MTKHLYSVKFVGQESLLVLASDATKAILIASEEVRTYEQDESQNDDEAVVGDLPTLKSVKHITSRVLGLSASDRRGLFPLLRADGSVLDVIGCTGPSHPDAREDDMPAEITVRWSGVGLDQVLTYIPKPHSPKKAKSGRGK